MDAAISMLEEISNPEKKRKQNFKKKKDYLKIMHHFWEKVEEINTKLIPLAIFILLGVIIFELFIHSEDPTTLLVVHTLDGVVIAIFVVDLIFLAIHSRNTRFFFKNYWLDILAIFPFGLLFTVVERAYQVAVATERLALGQAIAHEALEARKVVPILAESEKFTKVIRIVTRTLRVITKSRFFMEVTNRRKKQPPQKRKRK